MLLICNIIDGYRIDLYLKYFPRNQPNNNKYSTIYEATIHKYVKTISGQRVIYKEFIDESNGEIYLRSESRNRSN